MAPKRTTKAPQRTLRGRGKKRALRKVIRPVRRYVEEGIHHTSTTKKGKKPGKKGPRSLQSSAHGQGEIWRRFRSRVKGQLTRVRYYNAFLDAYTASGWKPTPEKRLRPEEELKKVREKVHRSKVLLRRILHELEEAYRDDKEVDCIVNADETGVDVSLLFCSRCLGNTETEENDIIMCDRKGCNRSYHQLCLDPPLRSEDIPPEEEDWFCPKCDCIVDCLGDINHDFGTRFSRAAEVFPEAAVPHAAAGEEEATISEEEESEDEDFNPAECRMELEGSTSGESSGLEDEDAVLSLPSDVSLSDLEASFFKRRTRSLKSQESRKPSIKPGKGKKRKLRLSFKGGRIGNDESEDSSASEGSETLIVEGKRRRTQVDYRKLNEILFGGEADPDEKNEKDWKLGDDLEEEGTGNRESNGISAARSLVAMARGKSKEDPTAHVKQEKRSLDRGQVKGHDSAGIRGKKNTKAYSAKETKKAQLVSKKGNAAKEKQQGRSRRVKTIKKQNMEPVSGEMGKRKEDTNGRKKQLDEKEKKPKKMRTQVEGRKKTEEPSQRTIPLTVLDQEPKAPAPVTRRKSTGSQNRTESATISSTPPPRLRRRSSLASQLLLSPCYNFPFMEGLQFYYPLAYGNSQPPPTSLGGNGRTAFV